MDRTERAERILDAAAELLLRWGYPKVTIEDVANLAEVGKGTLYLHWKTKDELFHAVVQRELAAVADELAADVAADPQQLRLHRLTRRHFRSVMDRPLLTASIRADTAVLGRLARERIAGRHQGALEDYVRLLAEHGLVRSAMPVEELVYAWHATVTGFFLAEPHPEGLERAADALANVVQAAFEPSDAGVGGDLAEPAARVVELFTDIAAEHRARYRSGSR